MKQTIYITEPDVIDVAKLKRILPATYELLLGDKEFSGTIPPTCTTLIIRSETKVTASVKDAFPNLTAVIRVGTGLDNIDVGFCTKQGIRIYNSPGANAEAVGDYVVGMMLIALRKIHTVTSEDVKTWNRFKFVGHTMSSRSIGIIGFGNIGKQVYRKLQGFTCKAFFVYDPFASQADLPDEITLLPSVNAVLKKSDIVTLHLPLLPETRNLIDKTNINLLRPGSVLINASRGGIVNEADIIKAAHSNKLTYIADTVENEPKPSSALIQAKNVIITPHIASLTEESEDNMLALALNNYFEQHAAN